MYFVNYLLDECDADIEQRGIYEVQEDKSRHQVPFVVVINTNAIFLPQNRDLSLHFRFSFQVTPLWCASVANKLEVVKTLIKHNSDVNSTSDTQSTPVRSACYMTNIEVRVTIHETSVTPGLLTAEISGEKQCSQKEKPKTTRAAKSKKINK